MTMANFELIKGHLPESVIALIDDIGLDITLILIEHFSGQRIYIQKTGFSGACRIKDRLGDDAYKKLLTAYPSMMLNIPRCAKARRILRDFSILHSHRGDRANGIAPLDLNACADRFLMTERGISKALRRIERLEAAVPGYRQIKASSAQVDLFEFLEG